MRPEFVAIFVKEVTAEFNRLAASHDHDKTRIQAELDHVTRQLTRLIEAIRSGVPGDAVKDEIAILEARKTELMASRDAAPPPAPRLHPNIAEVYRDKVAHLVSSLNDDGTRAKASGGHCHIVYRLAACPTVR